RVLGLELIDDADQHQRDHEQVADQHRLPDPRERGEGAGDDERDEPKPGAGGHPSAMVREIGLPTRGLRGHDGGRQAKPGLPSPLFRSTRLGRFPAACIGLGGFGRLMGMDDTRDAARNLMLTRRGLLFLTPGKGGARAREIEAVLLELAALGYVASARLRVALEGQSTAQLAVLREQTVAALAEQLGARQTHTPLFRKFPRGIPRDTRALWFQRVLSHFIQLPDQPCVHCRREGTTHVLRPCEHVVCDRCYDGSNYSACPICNRKVDRSSPFFQPDELRDPPSERIRFKLVDLGDDLDATARSLFEDFCARTQALSPADKADFTGLIEAC